MTVEELLRKRVIVENKWPGCPFEVGDILIADGDYYWVVGDTSWFSKIYKDNIEPYPYLMRPLHWWEERDVKDMPEYVKFQGKVCKIKEYVFKDWVTAFYTDDLKFGVIKHVDQTTPATEADYNEYIKAKTPQP